MKKIYLNIILVFFLSFIALNFIIELNNSTKVTVPENSVPNLDINCYYSKNQIISFFGEYGIKVVDIVKYSENRDCTGKVIGSNLTPGQSLKEISRVFITTHTSFYNLYFSYPLLNSIIFGVFLIFLISNMKSKLSVLIFVFLLSLLNFNSFLISSYRHNEPTSRLFQFQEFNMENHKDYTDPKYFVRELKVKND